MLKDSIVEVVTLGLFVCILFGTYKVLNTQSVRNKTEALESQLEVARAEVAMVLSRDLLEKDRYRQTISRLEATNQYLTSKLVDLSSVVEIPTKVYVVDPPIMELKFKPRKDSSIEELINDMGSSIDLRELEKLVDEFSNSLREA